ncbi:MAG: tryptophan synthase subunit alpha [Desulfovibrio sp.]|nr:tryptophan synthase subunit alpha [Desulfovibrio sp.]
MHELEEKIRLANDAGRIAIVPFLTAGFPDWNKFWEYLILIDKAGVDIIEIGVPFSDPVADGPVIEAASRRVLSQGVNLARIFEGLANYKFRASIALMGYMNPFLQFGLDALASRAKECRVAGFIIPDLPYEESGIINGILKERDIALIPLVGPNTSPQRMELYASDARGYVYVVSVMGITGERKRIALNIDAVIKRAKGIFSIPVALGFGLKHPSQLEELEVQPNAAVFGSALLVHLDNGGSPEEFIEPWLKYKAKK